MVYLAVTLSVIFARVIMVFWQRKQVNGTNATIRLAEDRPFARSGHG
jgi:hypothetical protein